MNLTARKPLVFTLLSAAGLAAIASCSDDTSGPLIPRAGYLVIAPSFNSNAASIVDVAIVAILLERTVDGSIVLDTAIALELGTDSVDVSLTVPVLSNDDTFLLTLSLIDTAGDTVFRGEPQIVTPSLTGGTDAPAVLVPLFYTGVGSNAAALAFLTTNPTVFFGDSVELTAVALDSAGLVIANTPIAFTSLDTLKATVPDNAVGVVVGGLERGEVSIEAKLLTDQSDTVVVTVQPVPSALLITSGDGQTGTVGAALADSLAVRVIAADSLGVGGVTVLFSSADTTASLSADSVTTDAQGLAAVSWTLGTVAGGQQVIAAVSGTADTVSFTATAQALPPAQLTFTVEPSTTTAVAAITPAVVLTALDALGNTDASFTGDVTVTIGTNPASGTISGTLTLAAVSGLATFSDLSIDRAGTGYTLTAAATGLTDATSSAFNITAGAAAVVALDGGDGQRATIGATLPQSLTVNVTDAVGNPASGVSVTWTVIAGGGTLTQPTTVTDTAGIATNQWQLGGTFGANGAQASVTGLSGSPVNFTALATPVGITKLWVGVTTDWASATNWDPAGVPAATDNVFVPAAAVNQPVLSVNQSVGDLLLETGATLDVSTVTITASGDVSAGTTIIGTGTVALTGSGKTVSGSLPNVTVSSDITVAGNTVVTGNLTVSGGSANLTLNGQTVTVSGTFTTQSSGVLTMISASDALTVTGDATFNGTTSNLTAGQITLQGNFSQASTAQSFSPSGTHSTVFNGTGAQTIFFTNAGATSSRFQELTISNAAGVSFTSSNAFVNGTATLASGAGSVTGTTVTIAGDLVDTPGSAWQVTNTTFSSGSPALPVNLATNITFTGAVTLATNLNLTGNLTVSGAGALTVGGILSVTGTYSVTNTIFTGAGPQAIPALAYTNVDVTGTARFATASTNIGGNLTVSGSGSLDMNSSTVTVTGNFETLNTAVLKMISSSDLLTVQGNILFAGGNTGGGGLCPATGCITNGTINASSNFTQDGTNSSQSFHARDFNEVRFVGTGAQSLSFANADSLNSHFANVRFDNTVGVTLATPIYAHCDLISLAGASPAIIIGNGNTLTVGGLDVNDLKLDRVLLVYDGIPDAHSSGSFFGFSNVEFANYVTTDIQMTVEDAGATLTFSGITLSTTPTGAGRYIQARDSNGAGPFLTINISSTPSNCTETFETELNGAVVNWTNC